jgi:hypothetical protein
MFRRRDKTPIVLRETVAPHMPVDDCVKSEPATSYGTPRYIPDDPSGMIREMMHNKPSELAEKMPSTGMNSCPGIILSCSSVP